MSMDQMAGMRLRALEGARRTQMFMASLAAESRQICCRCGREGHDASECPWRKTEKLEAA